MYFTEDKYAVIMNAILQLVYKIILFIIRDKDCPNKVLGLSQTINSKRYGFFIAAAKLSMSIVLFYVIDDSNCPLTWAIITNASIITPTHGLRYLILLYYYI